MAASAQTPAPPPALEYQVKASYLYNFVHFVSWPADVFGDDDKFNLCVVGADRFGNALDIFTGERVDNHEIIVRRLQQPAQAHDARCHLLFVAADAADPTAIASERGMLTVGEVAGFLEQGGIINLIEVRGRIRFQVNQQSAQQVGLIVSSRLLNLSTPPP